MNDFDDDYEVVLRGDMFIALEDFEVLSFEIPGSPGRGEIKQQIRIQEGDQIMFNGEIIRNGVSFYDFLFFPTRGESKIAELRFLISDIDFIFDKLERA